MSAIMELVGDKGIPREEVGRRTRERVLNFIREFAAAHGRPPTRGEVARGVSLSRNGLRPHFQAMASAGDVVLEDRGVRPR